MTNTQTEKKKEEGCDHPDLCVHCKGVSLLADGILYFNEAMLDEDKTPVLNLRRQIHKMALDRVRKTRPGLSEGITLYFDSPGGSVEDGLALFATIERVQAMGVPVDMHVDAGTHSMGTIVLQAVRRRTASKYVQFLVHNMTAGLHGRADQMEDMKKMLDNYAITLAEIYAKRTGYRNAKWWKAWYARTEQIITAEKALEMGLIDEIIS